MKFFATSKLSENIAETPEGYLICSNVPIARTGEMIYAAGETPIQPDTQGKVIVVRDQKEVFRPETIASFEGKSFTIYHPDGFVDPSNWKLLTCGIIQNVRRGTGANESDLMADILITDAEAIKKVKAGVREVSCGYDAEYIETGVGRGVQKNIVGNHVALVDEGRAGEAYAINDHKGKGLPMTLIDKIKAHFKKSEEDAIKLIEGEGPLPVKTKDGEPSAYDKMCSMMKDMGALLESMKPGDAQSAPTQVSPAQPVKAAGDAEEKPGDKPKEEPAKDAMEERFKKIEDALAQLMKGKDDKADGDEEKESEDASEGEEAEEMDDEEPSNGGEYGSEDDLEEGEEMTGDAKARIEIVAPGLKVSGKDAKAKALSACYDTTDGKEIIHRFTDGKPVDLKNEAQVEMVFVGVSELLKSERKKAFGSSKTFDIHKSALATPKGSMSADEINKKNEAFWAAKNK
jgi:uncharacterized protein